MLMARSLTATAIWNGLDVMCVSIGICSLCLKWQVCLGCLISVLLGVSSARGSQDAGCVCACATVLSIALRRSHKYIIRQLLKQDVCNSTLLVPKES